MTHYTPCHRASDRYDDDSVALESELWLDEQSAADEADSYEALDEDWLIEDLSDRAQAYEQTVPEAQSSDVPFPELMEAAVLVVQAAQAAGIEF